MATKEEISMVGFQIIANAGDAQTDLFEALNAAKAGNFKQARTLHESAKQSLIDAHNTQTKMLSLEAGGAAMDVTFIMMHAQDTLMTVMMLEKQMAFFIDEYERIAQLEQSLAKRTE